MTLDLHRNLKIEIKYIEDQYEKLRQLHLDIIKRHVGDFCRTNNATYAFGGWAAFYVDVEDADVNDDGELIADTSIDCYRVGTEWRYEIKADPTITKLLHTYENLFRAMPMCECNKGVWLGL